MNISQQLFRFSILIALCIFTACATDPLKNTTSKRTVAEVEPRLKADMPLAELLNFTKNTPIMTQGYTRFMLADGDLWIIEGRDEHGTVIIKDWRFQKK